MDEEDETAHYSDEEASAASSKPKPSAADGPMEEQGEEGEEGEKEAAEGERGGKTKEESKTEEKGNLAGERQSGDGQVRLTVPVCVHISVCQFYKLIFSTVP